MQEKCFSLVYLTLHTENEFILFSSTERKIIVLLHLQLKFAVDLHHLERELHALHLFRMALIFLVFL